MLVWADTCSASRESCFNAPASGLQLNTASMQILLPLLPILLLTLTSLAMVVIRLVKPAFAYYWLVAGAGSLLAWPVTLFLGFRLPLTVNLVAWKPAELFLASPALLYDYYSWPYAMALSTLALAVIFTAVARVQPASWRAWAATLMLAALGQLAVLAGNPLTLLLGWAALDMAELIILVVQLNQSSVRERLVASFSARAAGILLLIWAGIASIQAGQTGPAPLTFTSIPPQVAIYLLLAASLRLGVLPLHLPFLQELPLRRGLGTSLRLVPAAASLVLLARTAAIGLPVSIAPYLLVFTGVAALYGALAWATASDELNGRPFWILAMASLSVASAILAQPAASLAWGLACIFSGSLLFLASARRKRLYLLLALSLLALCMLPFSPTWNGSSLFSFGGPADRPSFHWSSENLPAYLVFTLAFILALALLLIGYLRHALRESEVPEGVERWVWVIYPFGLAYLPFTQFLIGWLTRPGLEEVQITGWLAGPLTLVLVLLIWYSSRSRPRFPQEAIQVWRLVFSFGWFYHLFWLVYRWVGQVIGWITTILEGEAGVLWAFVLLALIFTLIIKKGGG